MFKINIKYEVIFNKVSRDATVPCWRVKVYEIYDTMTAQVMSSFTYFDIKISNLKIIF